MMSESFSLAICTDRELLFHALGRMVEGVYRCELLPVKSVDAWFDSAAENAPACLVVDSEAQFPELIRKAREKRQGLPVVVWQRANAAEASLHALELGALGVLHDSSTASDVVLCFKTVREGHVWAPPSVAQAALDFRRYRLSPREWQVMKLVSQGLSNKEVATAMNITEGTTKVYLSRMFDKLEVSDRYELALLGLRHFAQSNSVLAKTGIFVYRPPARVSTYVERF